MQGCKNLEPRLFYQISLDQLVPPEHPVRRLAAVLDFSWVRSATAKYYSHTGKPSIDPLVIAKLMLLGYLYNIASERQLIRDLQVNLAYRWYLGYDLQESVPDHSVLSKARRRLGLSFFEQLFDYILQCCQQAGLVKGENVLLDSTVIAANASLDSVTTLRYRPADYWQQLEKTAESQDTTDKDTEVASPPIGHKRPRPTRTCDQKYSRTDPQASLYRRAGKGPKLAYKTHFLADEHQGVITAVATSAASVDDTAKVPELIEQHQRRCGQPQRAVGDHLYGSQDCLGYLQDRQIETVIRRRKGGNKHGGFDKSEFDYDVQADIYRCPVGQILRRRRTQKKNGKAFYSCDRGVCQACKLRSSCVSSDSADAVRQVTRFDTPYVRQAEAACGSSLGKRLLKKRQTCMEGLFGQAKTWHGLGRARWRGLWKMQLQSLLTAMVLNVKKLLSVVIQRAARSCRLAGDSGRYVCQKQIFSLLNYQCRFSKSVCAILTIGYLFGLVHIWP
jgi:transposase